MKTRYADLNSLVRPNTLALIGASDRPGSFGNMAARNLLIHSSFEGRLEMVSRGGGPVLGARAVSSIDQLQNDIDVALVVLPRQQVPSALATLDDLGTRFAIVMSSGFGESGDQVGVKLEDEMRAILQARSIRVVGPNCPGLANISRGLGLTIQPGFKEDISRGPIGVVAQSGGLTRSILQGADIGLGYSYFFSPGNQIDLDISDYVHFLVGDDKTEVIVLAAEKVGDSERFADVASQARDAGKRMVLLKAGLTEAGRAAALSHTGSLVGNVEAANAFADRHGIAVVETVEELVLSAKYLSQTAPVKGRRVAVFAMSGGAGVMQADAIDNAGLNMALLGEDSVKRLQRCTSSVTDFANPIDLPSPFETGLFREALGVVAVDPGVDAVIVPFNAWYDNHTRAYAEACVEVSSLGAAPIIPVWLSPRRGEEVDYLTSHGLHPASSPRTAAVVARVIAGRGDRSPEKEKGLSDLWDEARLRRSDELPVDHLVKIVLEDDAKKMLAAHGVPVTSEFVCASREEAEAAASKLGFPVILKLVGSEAMHRHGRGLVQGPIDSKEQLENAWAHIVANAESERLDADSFRILVSEYVVAQLEAHIGIMTDPEWGRLLSVGLGGSLVEELQDSNIIPLPASREDIVTALAGSKLLRVMHKLRMPTGTVGGFIDIVERVGLFVNANTSIREMDLNPVMLGTESDAIVVDALISMHANSVSAGLRTRGLVPRHGNRDRTTRVIP